MVVQLKSPEQKITLNTGGDGPHLIVSTTPSIAAGVESDVPGALCGFIGQVPVKVIGPVKCGATLFPTGGNDGRAVAGNTVQHGLHHDPIGTAMTSCGDGEHTVLAFIRWQHNLKWQTAKRKEEDLKNAIISMSNYVIPSFGLMAWWFADLARGERKPIIRNGFLAFSLVPLWAVLNLPRYHKYLTRDIYWIIPTLFVAGIANFRFFVEAAIYGNRNRSGAIMYLLSVCNLLGLIVSSIKLKIAAMEYTSSPDEVPVWGAWGNRVSKLFSFKKIMNWSGFSKNLIDTTRSEKHIIGQFLKIEEEE
mmetsp:Transcript_15593/g.20016  ORF Transcript_15593/g.20016 Transcript_15593/m.20016 type:complete len:305 (+) Transcript_15593:436-1350(+)